MVGFAAAHRTDRRRLTGVLRSVWRAAPWLLAAAVLLLVARQARTVDWREVGDALSELPLTRLVAAAAMAIASHALVAGFDLVGRALTRHRLGRARTLVTAAISYAFNLNFGSLVGAVAMRMRLYTRQGLAVGTVGRVIALSMLTNWLGYALVAGAVLVLAPPVPSIDVLTPGRLRALGLALLAAGVAYLAVCARTGPRTLHWRGHAWPLPGPRLALRQALVSSANWLLMGAIVWWLLDARLPYPLVLAVLLAAAVAGVVTHVPAGLGVLEAVFVAALADRIATPTLLAALLAYRALYYLLPLALALPLYAAGEWRARRSDR